MTGFRFTLPPGGDIPAKVAARRLGITETEFKTRLHDLFARGFPEPDDTTGQYDLDAIDEWRRQRHPHLFLTAKETARDAGAVIQNRLEAMANG